MKARKTATDIPKATQILINQAIDNGLPQSVLLEVVRRGAPKGKGDKLVRQVQDFLDGKRGR